MFRPRYPTVTIATVRAWRSAGLYVKIVRKYPDGRVLIQVGGPAHG